MLYLILTETSDRKNYQQRVELGMNISNTQTMKEAGFDIRTKCCCDRIGPLHVVIVRRDGKSTQRRARKYEEALALCMEKLGIESGDRL